MKELTQLHYFQTVAEMGHLTRAAEKLHISQPNLSNAIRRLEESVGAELFDRRNGRIFLNEYGRIYLSAVNKAFAQLNAAEEKIRLLSAGRQDFRVSVASVIWMLNDIMLQEFFTVEANSPIQIRQRVDTLDEIIKDLWDGKLDMALIPQAALPPEMRWNPVASCHIGILMSQTHPLAVRQSILLDELSMDKFVCNTFGIGRELMEQYCMQAGFRPNIVFESTDFRSIAAWVEAGRGVTLISSYEAMMLLVKSPQCPPIVVRKISGKELMLPLGLAFDPDQRPLVCAPLFTFALDYFKSLGEEAAQYWNTLVTES